MESREEREKISLLELSMNFSTYSIENKKYDLFVRIESSMALNQLIDVLRNMSSSPAKNVDELFQPLLDLFSRRWSGIKKTDASYLHSPHLKANSAYKQVAFYASIKFLKHTFELIMPTIKWNDFFEKNGNAIWLHEFILDDYECPMHVLQTFFLDANQKEQRVNESKLFYKCVNGHLEELTSLERIRLTNHSALISDYYLQWNANKIDTIENMEWKDKLEEAFSDISYQVTSSYDQEGDRLLKQYIFSQVNTLDELINLMRAHIPNMNDWPEFLSRTPSEELCRILLNMPVLPSLSEKLLLEKAEKELNTKVQNLVLVNEEEWIRACIYCYSELYNRTRDNAPESKSNVGYYASYVLPVSVTGFFSKSRKCSSCDVFREFLLSSHPLDDLEGYLLTGGIHKEEDLHKAHWKPLTINPYFYGTSTLVKLVQITLDAGKELKKFKRSFS